VGNGQGSLRRVGRARGARSRVSAAAVLMAVAAVTVTISRGPVAEAVGAAPVTYVPQFVPSATASFQEFPVPGATGRSPGGITQGPDGRMWFTQLDEKKVGAISTTGTIQQFEVASGPTGITLGPDANLWFLQNEGHEIGRLTPGGVLTEFPVPSLFAVAQGLFEGITTGPDGNIWYTDASSTRIGRLTPAGTITEQSVSGAPFAITAGPDHNLWFGKFFGGVGHIRPTFTDPGDIPGITAGPDGNIWYTDTRANKIGRVTPAGVVTEFAVPTTASEPGDITTGPDGNLWFTEISGNRIGRITPAGVITEVHIPTPGSRPQGIATGPDGKLWFTQAATHSVASLDPATVMAPPGPCLVVRADTRLTADVGPCAGDGIVVAADGVTLDLNGHRVYASPGPPRTGDFSGIHLTGVRDVTVRNGEVTGFDAGVVIDRGTHNTIARLNVHDNLGVADSGSQLGDGIAAFHSRNNVIQGNTVARNGIYDGISILGLASDNNIVRANDVHDNTAEQAFGSPGLGTGIIVNAFLELENNGRGRSVSGNVVVSNRVANNTSSGISMISSVRSRVSDNTVDHNGFGPGGAGVGSSPGNGIGITALQLATKSTQDVVENNVVTGNANDGIQIATRYNTIRANTATGNGVGFGNGLNYGRFDLADENGEAFNGKKPDCDSNVWWDNTWGPVDPVKGSGGYNQLCVTPGGTGPVQR
jgi:parallel beta-helix repeat protein